MQYITTENYFPVK